MAKIPVIFSLIVTLTSPSSLLGSPSEVYKYGIRFAISVLFIPLGIYLSSFVFIPVYFRCGISTVNEFLMMRFGVLTKYTISALTILQMLFYMSTCLYGAVLALSAVTDLSLETSIVALGALCAIYCSIGGLKAVIWTDVFQALLMITCLLSIYTAAIMDAGGVSKIFYRAKEGHRLDFSDIFQLDFTKRFGFWACSIRGLLTGFGFYGTSQLEVQRLLSLSSLKRAQSTMRISAIPMAFGYMTCMVAGLLLYSAYYLCDPVLNTEKTGIKSYDQIVPAYIVSRFSSFPGMTGLCIAGIFSAALSTISSALNSVSAVTVIDFIKPLCKENKLSDLKLVWIAKILTIMYGGICIGLSFCFLNVTSIKQLVHVMVSLPEGPIAAVFVIGVLTRKACDKCACFGLVMGYIIIGWISFGSLIAKYSQPTLQMSASNCALYQNISVNSFSSCENTGQCTSMSPLSQSLEKNIFILYKISFMWFPVMGFLLTLIFILLAVVFTGWKRNVIPPDSDCLSPVTRVWMKTSVQQPKDVKENTYELNECT